jgi:manganese/iron transport system permease protein/iron/zinc/copper transport system permease protein
MSTLLEPFDYEFFVRGIIAATMVSGLCSFIGVYIVLRRMSYIGHGLSHAVFGGAVVSYVMSFNFYIGASIWGFLSALLINATSRRRPVIGADAAIGIITTASFALGIALISRYRTFTRSFDAALFGNILGVTENDLYAMAAVTAATLLIVFFIYKQLLFTTFDPDVARFHGVPVDWMDTLFSLMLAAVIVVSMQVLGVTLIAATIVTPPIIARLLTNSFHRMLIISTFVGTFCGFAGIYISYFIDVSSGATIVLLASFLFVVTLALTSVRDWFVARAPRATVSRPPVTHEAHLFE